VDELRATCQRQAREIAALGEAIGAFRMGAGALKAENADLRAENARVRAHPEPAEVRLARDTGAPAAARAVVTSRLRDRVPARVLERAQLLASELTTNSVRHSDAPADTALVLRVAVSSSAVRVEVEDAGHGGTIALRAPDLEGGGGFGLNLVQTLSERWGVERAAAGGTRVWAHLAVEHLSALRSAF
jgi:anti-sigma regulatory factor (Ser/Thr protein kinase)